ncbi:MAG: hypothetical protein R3C11_28115 [Planctomycetaceae bacterium]
MSLQLVTKNTRKLSKVVKAFDIGITSSAGQRLKFQELHDKYVVPRIYF